MSNTTKTKTPKGRKANEAKLERMLHGAFSRYDPATRVDSFESAMLLTSDRGIVVEIDGREFQITIKRSR